MATPRVPGNEPDSNDMSQEPSIAGEAVNPQPAAPDLSEEDQAAKLGDFA
jgi:hypothetical protein